MKLHKFEKPKRKIQYHKLLSSDCYIYTDTQDLRTMDQPIYNPPNPYVGTMRVFPGTLIKITGKPRIGANRFAINLQVGPSLNPRDDLALHFSPCFTPHPPKIVRNSLISSSWGPGESSGPFVFAQGQPFEVMILTEEHKFKIAINGSHYCEFNHRVSYEEITHLSIDGDVDIEKITVEDNDSYKSQQSGPQPSGYNPSGSQLSGPQPSAPQPYVNPPFSSQPAPAPSQAFYGPPPLPSMPLYPSGPVPGPAPGPQPSQPYNSTYHTGHQQFGPTPGGAYSGPIPSGPFSAPQPPSHYSGQQPSGPQPSQPYSYPGHSPYGSQPYQGGYNQPAYGVSS